jgi:hypothetical protein
MTLWLYAGRPFTGRRFACLLTSACASTPLLRQQCYNPDAQLAEVLPAYEAARASGCGADARSLKVQTATGTRAKSPGSASCARPMRPR